jgi:hypothetical protein
MHAQFFNGCETFEDKEAILTLVVDFKGKCLDLDPLFPKDR